MGRKQQFGKQGVNLKRKGNLPVGVVIIGTFDFGVVFSVWCCFVLKGALQWC